jgi:hypothetical protein
MPQQMDDARVARILTFCEGMRADDMAALKDLLRGTGDTEFDDGEYEEGTDLGRAYGQDAKLTAFREKHGLTRSVPRVGVPGLSYPEPTSERRVAIAPPTEAALDQFRKQHGLTARRIRHV